jgi:hypothetical protein
MVEATDFKFEQSILNDALSLTPSIPLYHYTGQDGLLGIIKERAIWASHHQCLNDTQEFLHAKSLIRSEVDKHRTDADGNTIKLLDEMQATLEGPKGNEEVNLYVASFSEDGDSLSQWRAYGGQTAGFALGFNGTEIKRILHPRFNIVRCIYEPEEQRKIAAAIVAEVLGKIHPKELVGLANQKMEAALNLRLMIHKFALMFKDKKFEGEKEWRFVSKGPLMEGLPYHSNKESQVQFGVRAGKSMLIPYWQIRLFESKRPFPLQEVVVGPNPNMEQSHRSLQSFLYSQELRDICVRDSEVPYRNW